MRSKPIVLIVCDYYLPGYKSGGGMRTIVNIVERLRELYDFRIITRDHDGPRDRTPYTDVEINGWNKIGGAKVYYLSKDNLRLSKLRELILEINPGVIYLNSCFATPAIFVLQLRQMKLIPYLNIIVAPCGELTPGALKLKSGKKKLFLSVAKISRLYKNVIWKPSTIFEKKEIERLKPVKAQYFVCSDMPAKDIFPEHDLADKPYKQAGSVRLIILSRLMRSKNIKWLFENIAVTDGKMSVDIYGPIEDDRYWQECETVFEKLPPQIEVEYKGEIPHEDVFGTLLKYHFFLLPTLGENFGHIVLEALAGGCPLIISNRTPWKNLEEKKIGWDIPLENPVLWNEVFAETIAMNNSDYREMSDNAIEFLGKWLADEDFESDTIDVLNYGINGL